MLDPYAPLLGSVAQQGVPTFTPPALFFNGDLETGTFAQFTSGTNVESGNTLTIETSSPLEGTYYAHSTFGGTNQRAYAWAAFTAQTEMWVLGLFRVANFAMATTETMERVIFLRDSSSWVFDLSIQWQTGNGSRWVIRNHAGSTVYAGSYGEIVNGTPYVVELHFKPESGSGTNDGQTEFWVDGTLKFSKTDVTGTDGLSPDNAIIGGLGANPASGAVIDFDKIQMSAVSKVGP